MSIEVKLFASLRETLGRASVTLEAGRAGTVAEVWAVVADARPMPANTLMAVNMDYVDAQQPVRDGDEIAFFPPVTGG